jgi:ubiquitin C-terminal hydrolase
VAVPKDTPYEECLRGRVNYDKASGRFTLFADRCIIMDNRQVSAIMNEFNLPMGTRGLADDRYQCPKCLREKPTRKQEEKDWDY